MSTEDILLWFVYAAALVGKDRPMNFRRTTLAWFRDLHAVRDMLASRGIRL